MVKPKGSDEEISFGLFACEVEIIQLLQNFLIHEAHQISSPRGVDVS